MNSHEMRNLGGSKRAFLFVFVNNMKWGKNDLCGVQKSNGELNVNKQSSGKKRFIVAFFLLCHCQWC